jgi:uncharacterized membrane protein
LGTADQWAYSMMPEMVGVVAMLSFISTDLILNLQMQIRKARVKDAAMSLVFNHFYTPTRILEFKSLVFNAQFPSHGDKRFAQAEFHV